MENMTVAKWVDKWAVYLDDSMDMTLAMKMVVGMVSQKAEWWVDEMGEQWVLNWAGKMAVVLG